MKTTIVLISGKQGAGKDTLVDATSKMITRMGTIEAHHIKFADPLYEMHDAVRIVADKYGIERTEPKDGPLLQLLGTEWGRSTKGENVWVDAFKERVKQIQSKTHPTKRCVIFCSDCRFPNELSSFPQALKVRLECDRDIRKKRCSQWRENETHPSEVSLDEASKNKGFDLYLDTGVHDVNHCKTILEAEILKI